MKPNCLLNLLLILATLLYSAPATHAAEPPHTLDSTAAADALLGATRASTESSAIQDTILQHAAFDFSERAIHPSWDANIPTLSSETQLRETENGLRHPLELVIPLTLPPFRPMADNVSGVITQSTTWTLTNSPYILTSDVVVTTGVTLTVAPGVVVMGQSETELRVLGHLEALGTVTQPITFTSATDSGPNQWQGLLFDGGTGELRHATVRYGGHGGSVLGSSGSNITVRNVLTGAVHIESSRVISEYAWDSGWHRPDYGLFIANSQAVISDTLFSGNGYTTDDHALYATGTSTVTVTNTSFENNDGTGLYANGIITVTNATFQDNGGVGLYTTDSALVWVSDSTFTNNGSHPLRTAAFNLHRALSGNTFSDNSPNRLLLTEGVLGSSLTLSTTNGLGGYELEGDLTVPAGMTLTVQPGTSVMGQSETELRVLGHLEALGTMTQPITFTSATDSGPNQWQGLLFDGGTGELRHATVRYGGHGGSVLGSSGSNITVRNVLTGAVHIESSRVISEYAWDWGWHRPDYGLFIANSQVVIGDTLFSSNGYNTDDYALYATGTSTVITVTDSTFRNNAGPGLYIGSDTVVSLANSIIESNGSYGIQANDAVVTITGSTVSSNENVGVRVQNSAMTVEDSSITGNANFGIENTSSTPIVQAVENWWGHPSGPYHPDTNPDGLGDRVSDDVAYTPWLVSPPGSRWSEPLVLGHPMTDSVASLEFKDYHSVITAGLSLVLKIVPLSGTDALWVYSRLDGPPSWTRYDHRTQEKTGRGTYELLVSPTQDGTYHFSVYGRDVADSGGNYRIVVNAVEERYLSDVSPHSAGNAGEITLDLSGLGFADGMQVELRNASLPTLAADEVTSVSPTTLWAHFDLNGATPGVYDVYAVWPDSQEEVLESVFEVTPGTGSHLEAQIVVRETVRPGRQYVLWLGYANTGDADMLAPLFVISSTTGTPMRLTDEEPFEGKPVQVLGINPEGYSGRLSPGTSSRIPIYFYVPPDTGAHEMLDFDLAIMISDTMSINWDEVEDEVQPPDVDPDVWDVLWPILTAQIGDTWGDYRQALANNAGYLSSLGRTVYSVRELFRFEVRKALGMNPRTILAGQIDAYAPAPGISIQFGRVFPASLEGRFYLGPLGRGWSHSYDIALEKQSDGDIMMHWPGSFTRLFRSNGDGTYTALPGDYGTLTLTGDIFELTEKDGTVYRFRADRQLDYIEDLNGNRITAAYDGSGRLIEIQHSNSDSLTLEYNAHDRISRLTDHVGRTTAFGYDVTGEHLLTVTAPGNRTITYTYSLTGGQPTDHALLSVAYPDGTHQYYAYDTLGRLTDEYRDGGAEQILYTYDAMSRIYATDAYSHTTVISPDEYGRPDKVKDALGRELGQEYSSEFNLSQLTDPAGQTYEFTYDLLGNVIGAEDPLGHQIMLGYDTRFSQIVLLEDARGNQSTFAYDDAGNLTSLTYPDGSSETIAYDSVGNPISYTSRSGDVISYTYNAQGQLLRKDYPDGSWVAYTYDAAGNMTTASDVSGTITMTYDADTDLLTRIDYPTGHYFEYSYNDAGQRTQRLDQDGHELNYEYDAAGRLSRLYDENGTGIILYEYDDNGRLSRESKSNGTYTGNEYDAAGQLLSMVNYAPDDSVQSRFDYTYDANGNRTSMTTLSGTTTYDYDLIGQLVGVTYPDGRRVTYEYDAAGNRVTVTDDGTPTAYVTNNLNQYTQVGDATYTYDASGNMTSKTVATGTITYEYDFDNRLIRVTTPLSGTWEYTYDALGNRVAVERDGVVTRYIHDPIGLVDVAAEYDGGGALVARYVQGLGLVARIDATGSPAYYAFDATGHTRQLTDETGSVANTYNYTPFGITLQANETIPNSFQYAGRFGVMTQKNGLSFMQSHFYSAKEGKTFSEGHLGIAARDPKARSVGNHPTDRIDQARLVTPGRIESVLSYIGGATASIREHLGDIGRLKDASKFVKVTGKMLSALGAFESGFEIGTGINERDWKKVSHGAGYAGFGLLGAAIGLTNPIGWVVLGATGLAVAFDIWMDWKIEQISKLPPGSTQHIGSDSTENIRPRDPNEKVGPAGVGEQHLVSADNELYYVIYFENMPTASAPAQEVFVTDDLDPELDWNTFRLTEIAWGDRVIAIPQDEAHLYIRETVPDYRDSVNKSWWVDITAEIDYQTGRASWTFRTLDPVTGDLPDDPLAGFLPPNDETGRGEGHVALSIKPKADVALGTPITNTASIVFDTNDPIATNEVWNTIGVISDLALTKTDNPDPVTAGNNLTYTIIITNNDPDDATDVIVTDTLPSGVTFSSAKPGCTESSGTVTCAAGTLTSGTNITFTIIVTIAPSTTGIITNTATVASNETDLELNDNTASESTTINAQADLIFLPLVIRNN